MVSSGWRVTSDEWRVTTDDWRLTTDDWRLTTDDWRLTTDDWRLTTDDWRLTTDDWRLTTDDWLLSIVYCLLSIDYCLLYIVYCLLSIVYCLLSIVYCLLSIVYCLLSIVYCLLSIVCWLVTSDRLSVTGGQQSLRSPPRPPSTLQIDSFVPSFITGRRLPSVSLLHRSLTDFFRQIQEDNRARSEAGPVGARPLGRGGGGWGGGWGGVRTACVMGADKGWQARPHRAALISCVHIDGNAPSESNRACFVNDPITTVELLIGGFETAKQAGIRRRHGRVRQKIDGSPRFHWRASYSSKKQKRERDAAWEEMGKTEKLNRSCSWKIRFEYINLICHIQ